MTSRHRRRKCQHSWRPLASVITTLYYVAVLPMSCSLMLRTLYFSSSSVLSCFLCTMHVFDIQA